MCDARLRIVNSVVRWPGSTHDSRILRESGIYEHLEQNHNGNVILGDSGYPLKQWLMVPFLDPRSDGENQFNGSHMVTRATIERCNGVLKRRFACLHSGLRMRPDRACTVIRATLVLHNKCIQLGHNIDEVPPDNGNNDGIPPAAHEQDGGDISGKVARRQIVATHFT